MKLLVELISRLLEPEERSFVLGDMAELNDSGTKALRGMVGLVARRQLALWKNWHPWLALIGLVGIVDPILWVVTARLSSPLFMDIRTYWKVGSLYSSGMTIREEFLLFLILAIGMVFWAWTSGFVLGCLSRRTLWLTGTLYFLLWTFPLPRALFFMLRLPARHQQDRPMILLMVLLQTAAYLCLFVFPSIKGLRYSLRSGALSFRDAAFLVLIILCLTWLATWTGGWPAAAVTRWAGGPWNPSQGWQSRLLFYLVLAWPVTYLLLTAKRRPFAKLKGDGEF